MAELLVNQPTEKQAAEYDDADELNLHAGLSGVLAHSTEYNVISGRFVN